jgi:hypothetical protein
MPNPVHKPSSSKYEAQPSIEEQIRQRAYKLYEQRGWVDGHDLADWLQAEEEILGKGRKATAA